MSNRPSLARKQTPRSEQQRKDALNEGLSINVDGRVYTVRMGDLKSIDTMALRRATGYSFTGLMRAVQSDPDIDLIAAIVWLARRTEGEKLLDYEAVASEIGYDVDIDIVDDEPGEEADPEA